MEISPALCLLNAVSVRAQSQPQVLQRKLLKLKPAETRAQRRRKQLQQRQEPDEEESRCQQRQEPKEEESSCQTWYTILKWCQFAKANASNTFTSFGDMASMKCSDQVTAFGDLAAF
ncbi:hypothetical protein AVEN_71510-1 [Araneus ventricosus]|uniref:Uncharacterized protein n=1 Tax=Araneus ventricosus TaxID=182803 RepID=A0A4Y2FAT5_ARAVE|nr:hypothetical protein AVEN_71510-1 [Araneus ventricosus]